MTDQRAPIVAYCAVIYSHQLIKAIGDGDKVAGLSHAVFALRLPEAEVQMEVPKSDLPHPQMSGLTTVRHDDAIILNFRGSQSGLSDMRAVSARRSIAAAMGPVELIISIHNGEADAIDWRDDILRAIAEGGNNICKKIHYIRA